MLKVMIFIDGTWLYYSKTKLGDAAREDFALDYGKLPPALTAELQHELPGHEIDLVRTYLFGSYAWNYDLLDDDSAARQKDFFNMLKERHHYEVEVFPIDFKGRRLRRVDRDPEDAFEPREKCVDVALTTSLMFNAAVPGALDIAVVVAGDADFVPLLQTVRRLGKRVVLASIRNSCCREFADPQDGAGITDFAPIWLDSLLDALELTYERHQLRCQSPLHIGEPLVWTTFSPNRNEKFYCDECRARFLQQKQEEEEELAPADAPPPPHYEPTPRTDETLDGSLEGYIKAKFDDRGYGFVHGNNGNDYFFHLTDLRQGLEFERLTNGLPVLFEVKKEPVGDKAGAASNVRPCEAREPVDFPAQDVHDEEVPAEDPLPQ